MDHGHEQNSHESAAVQARSEAVANLQAILNTVVDAIITIDDRGVIQLANHATERLFGYSQNELVGKNVSMLMPAPYRQEHDGYLKNYLATGEAKIIGIGREVVGLKKDGTLFPIDLAVSEVVFGSSRQFTGVIRDMTDRKRAEEALRQERVFSDNLLETAHAIVLILDPEGRIARLNPYMEQLTGFALDEVRGANWFEAFLPERERKQVRELFARTLAGTPVHSHVNSILTREGRERTIAWSGRRLVDADGEITGVLVIGSDITALKNAEQKLIQSERLAAIGQMVTGLAHESRNALQRARACLEMLQLDLAEEQTYLDLIGRTDTALGELHRLYEEVRGYAAPLQLECRPCNLIELCAETWDHLAAQRAGRSVQLRTDGDRESCFCDCDRQRVSQVFRNILENALAVAPEGSEIVARCEPSELEGQPAFLVAIQDSGPGLNAEEAARIFEPFFTTKTKGTGLGMAIVKRIVEAHGGEIHVGNSSAGPGAQVVLTLPAERLEHSQR